MKSTYKFLGQFFLIVCLAIEGFSQTTLPEPLLDWPLGGSHPEQYSRRDSFRGRAWANAIKSPGSIFHAITDRHGKAGGATSFDPNGNSSCYMEPFSNTSVAKDKDVTVSFWFKSDHPMTGDEDNLTQLGRLFSLNPDGFSGGIAISRFHGAITQERKVNGKQWNLWTYEPMVVKEAGWYHVVAIFAKNYTRITLFRPDDTKLCTYNYMGNDYGKILVLGEKSDPSGGHLTWGTVDDFKLYDQALTEAQITQLHNEESVAPWAYWAITGTDLSKSTIDDRSIHDHQLQRNGAKIEFIKTTANPSAPTDYAANLKGPDYMYYASPVNLNASFTVAFHAYVTGTISTADVMVSDRNDVSNSGTNIFLNFDNSGKPKLRKGSTTLVSSSKALSPNKWYHIMLTRDIEKSTKNTTLYIDGIEAGTGHFTEPFSARYFGGSLDFVGYDGWFDEIRIYKRAVPVTEAVKWPGLSGKSSSSRRLAKSNDVEIEENSSSLAYPNPVRGVLHVPVNTEVATDLNFSLFNLLGMKVYQETRPQVKGKQVIVLNDLNKVGLKGNSIYLLKVSDQSGKELLVQRLKLQ